jgi:hypothetical protein
VWAIFLVLNVALTFASRELVRELLERRWRAGIGLKRILIAGSGELGRLVADKILEHRELGYQIVGFVDDGAAAITSATAACRCSARSTRRPTSRARSGRSPLRRAAARAARADAAAHREHEPRVRRREGGARPAAGDRAARRLEDLDGVPVININDVPLQGFNTIVKRGIDIAISSVALVVLAIPFWLIAALVKLTSRGDGVLPQERMGLDGKPFMIYKFRSMYDDAEADTGPVFASEQDPRRTPLGSCCAGRTSTSCRSSGTCCSGDMSIRRPAARAARCSWRSSRTRFRSYMLRTR